MIQIKQVKQIPELDWTQIAAREMLEQGLDAVADTDIIWQVGDVAVCGFKWFSFMRPPFMWFALARGVTMRTLIDFRALAERIPLGTITAVRESGSIERRFAEFYGFIDINEVVELSTGTYRWFRKG